MERRNFLRMGLASASGLLLGGGHLPAQASSQLSRKFAQEAYRGNLIKAGWLNLPKARASWVKDQEYPFLNEIDADIRGTGAGKVALLYKYMEAVLGSPLRPYSQQIGDCVSMGFGRGVDILTCIQIVMRNSPQRWRGEAATEIIYGGSRVESGSKYGYDFWGDGSIGVLAADFIKNWGILLRKKYLGQFDYRYYTGEMATKLGRAGVPDALEPLCKLHPVGNVAIVKTWEEARDCVYNGHPVALCSSQGFRTRTGRDKDGFLPAGGKWMHCMLLAGIDDKHSRPGGLIINSWGDFVNGPKRHGQPDGSFWADAAVIDRMCAQGDSIAMSSYAGYPKQNYFLY